jgi:hypothetical protein
MTGESSLSYPSDKQGLLRVAEFLPKVSLIAVAQEPGRQSLLSLPTAHRSEQGPSISSSRTELNIGKKKGRRPHQGSDPLPPRILPSAR